MVGMQPLEFPAGEGARLELILQPDPNNQNEVVLYQGLSEVFPSPGNFTPAEPQTGRRAYRKYVENNLRFPESALTAPQVVMLSFILTAEGEFTEFEVFRTPGPGFTSEARRIILEGPPWRPAENPAGPVDEKVNVRIRFDRGKD
jgi:hypothetical protein